MRSPRQLPGVEWGPCESGCLYLALLRHANGPRLCLLVGFGRKWLQRAENDANDPGTDIEGESGTCLAALAHDQNRRQAMVESELFTKGLETRRQVLGAKYVDANLAGSDDFMMMFQHAVTELAWG